MLNELVAAMGDVGHHASRSPVVARFQTQEEFIASQNRVRADIYPADVSGAINRREPVVAVVDHVLVRRAVRYIFKVQPQIHAVRKTDLSRIGGGVGAILSAERARRLPSRTRARDMLHGAERQTRLQNNGGLASR